MSPILVGLLGAGAGVALWELLLKPAPIDEIIGCTTLAKANQAAALLEQNGIPSRIQQAFADSYGILVKKADVIRATQIVDIRNF